jgi:hypothetical protein
VVKRLTLLIVILSLAVGVLAGTPLHDPNDGMMECCIRAKSKDKSPKAEAARLCCAINCSTTTPTSSGASFNAAPANFTIIDSAYSREVLARTFQPSYIQHHAFLI